jgi:hypothetical protein
LAHYIERLEKETQLSEFVDLMEKIRISIVGKEKEKPLVNSDEVRKIYSRYWYSSNFQ